MENVCSYPGEMVGILGHLFHFLSPPRDSPITADRALETFFYLNLGRQLDLFLWLALWLEHPGSARPGFPECQAKVHGILVCQSLKSCNLDDIAVWRTVMQVQPSSRGLRPYHSMGERPQSCLNVHWAKCKLL